MSLLTQAAADEDGDTIQALRDRCKHLDSMLDTLQQLCERRGATIAKLEADLEAIGAGGVGPLIPRDQQDEPVAWQYRMRPDWGSKKDCWGPWQDCTKEQAAMYQRVPLLNDWVYESRQLYTHPQPARQPLTDYQVTQLAHRTCWRYRHSSDPHHSHTYTFNHSTLLDFARQLREDGAA